MNEQKETDIDEQSSDYARLCRAAWDVTQARCYYHELGNLLEAAERLFHVLESLNVQCKCDPPGSGKEWCSGHCQLRMI